MGAFRFPLLPDQGRTILKCVRGIAAGAAAAVHDPADLNLEPRPEAVERTGSIAGFEIDRDGAID